MRSDIVTGISAVAVTGEVLCVAAAILWHGRLHTHPQSERSFMIYDRWTNTVQVCTTGNLDKAYNRATQCYDVEQIGKF
jgi:hypothetical protein